MKSKDTETKSPRGKQDVRVFYLHGYVSALSSSYFFK
jgi:hypothetical protein